MYRTLISQDSSVYMSMIVLFAFLTCLRGFYQNYNFMRMHMRAPRTGRGRGRRLLTGSNHMIITNNMMPVIGAMVTIIEKQRTIVQRGDKL